MSSTWSPATLALIDSVHDTDYSGGSLSRFGVYVGDHRDHLRAFGDETFNAVDFAVGAWRIATALMSPGYVRIRRDLAGITVSAAEDETDLLVATVAVPLRHAHLTVGKALRSSTWRDWTQFAWTGAAPHYLNAAPKDRHRAILTTTQVRVPISAAGLPTPQGTSDRELTDNARTAVATLVDQINHLAGQAVADITGRTAGL